MNHSVYPCLQEALVAPARVPAGTGTQGPAFRFWYRADLLEGASTTVFDDVYLPAAHHLLGERVVFTSRVDHLDRRRAFTAEFKAEAVRLCRVGDRSIAEVAKDLDRRASRACSTGKSAPPIRISGSSMRATPTADAFRGTGHGCHRVDYWFDSVG